MERTRREFIRESTTLLAGAAVLAESPSLLAAPAAGVKWPIGCFNRPWTKWSFDDTLKAIKA
ncbi:MAG TPA: sugar phosphate isomerase/epimerase, partial [Vicinamibacteria bacterium]|nr:sugar phosphate isomerase/epimerase [Vicinamibacteria bacterium]